MASSLGYVLMNWTAEFARHSKAKKALKKKKVAEDVKKEQREEDTKQQQISQLSRAITSAVQTEGIKKYLK
jgi:hypothetical protein